MAARLKRDTRIPLAEDQPFADVEQAAAYMAVGRGAIYSAIKEGTLPAVKVGNQFRIPVLSIRKLAGLD